MENILLIDYGSTYTKVTAVDVSGPRLLGCASAYTTVSTGVGEGLANALAELERRTGKLEFHKRLACSSAAGGLRMVAIGLVPELTAKAASMASMGAGAKIVGLYSYELTEDDVAEITAKAPDILLLTGGTDGGNAKCVLHNAEMLAGAAGEFPIIVAGNRSSGHEVMRLLAHRRAYLCENVMPSIGQLNIEPARKLIRDIFLERIVRAKGLDGGNKPGVYKGLSADKEPNGGSKPGGGEPGYSVLMPTPAAVLTAVQLLAGETGDLVTVDVGGATTDVYSITDGAPRGAGVIYKGLPEPFAKRTVEGDIGMRYSAHGIVEAAGIPRIAKLAELPEEMVSEHVEYLTEHTDTLPETSEQKALDFALAAAAIETATLRHAGSIEEVYTAAGRAYIQTGKDLSDVGMIVLTGGAMIHAEKQADLASYALYNDREPQSLRPKKAKVLVDKRYILASMGLLCGYSRSAAIEIMKYALK